MFVVIVNYRLFQIAQTIESSMAQNHFLKIRSHLRLHQMYIQKIERPRETERDEVRGRRARWRGWRMKEMREKKEKGGEREGRNRGKEWGRKEREKHI